jgi:hypothetical protein
MNALRDDVYAALESSVFPDESDVDGDYIDRAVADPETYAPAIAELLEQQFGPNGTGEGHAATDMIPHIVAWLKGPAKEWLE